MCVLAYYMRFLLCSVSSQDLQCLMSGIHGTVHISYRSIPVFLVMNQSGWIILFYKSSAGYKAASESWFVSQWPEQNTWMVLIPSYHTFRTIHIAFFPDRIITDLIHVFGISHLVTLQISFLHHIKSKTVTHIQKIRMWRVMRGSYCIDIVLFHQIQIRQHILFCNASSCIFIPVMSVYSF